MDACQLRVGRARLKDYLARGFFVLITGSKFFTGPAFSGALLVPQSRAEQAAAVQVSPNALAGYSTCYDWPALWPGLRNAFPAIPNYGAWLRWEAALSEMEGYFAVPAWFREEFFAKLAAELRAVLGASSSLVSINSLEASVDTVLDGEMRHQTIFPFVPCHDGQKLSSLQCGDLYRAMRQDLSNDAPDPLKRVAARASEIGQPVILGHLPSAALRICASARHIRCHWEDDLSVRDAVSAVLEDARSVVAKLDWLISNPQLREGP